SQNTQGRAMSSALRPEDPEITNQTVSEVRLNAELQHAAQQHVLRFLPVGAVGVVQHEDGPSVERVEQFDVADHVRAAQLHALRQTQIQLFESVTVQRARHD